MKRIESEFVPLLIFNNKGGKNAKLLKRYREPSWNYPVVRFLDGKGHDLIPRKDKLYTIKAIEARMKQALQAATTKE